MNQETIFWHDYETFGIDPQLSNVAQFAGIRTDMDLNIIGEEVNIICKPTLDRLPSPEACMVTGISPLYNKLNGMNEIEFFQKVNAELGKSNTCGVGYNNLSFDDEVTRNGLYRVLLNPYEREWKNGCSRWDLLNILRIVDAVKPNTFNVPRDKETGKKIFKLEALSAANNIEHENAHDALSDVIATIEMAKIIKSKEPELFNLLFSQRRKNDVKNKITNFEGLIHKPFIMAESFFGGDQNFVEVVFPVYIKDTDVYCIKLSKDLNELVTYINNPEEAKLKLYKKKDEMEDNEERLPIHSFKINKCPVFLPMEYMNKENADLIGLSGDQIRESLKILKENFSPIKTLIKEMFQDNNFESENKDVDQMIYNGFFVPNDNMLFAQIKSTTTPFLMETLENIKDKFVDVRSYELVYRYICRNFYEELEQEEMDKWDIFCKKRIEEGKYTLTLKEYSDKITELEIEYKDDKRRMKVLKDLTIFGEKIEQKFYKK